VLLHAAFVLAMCAAQMTYWKFTANAQAQVAAAREQARGDSERALREAAEASARREAEAERLASADLARSADLTARLETVLAKVGEVAASAARVRT
jgi:methyl-accepting chemotaxis protein